MMNDRIELRIILRALRRWWWLLIAAMIAGALIGRFMSDRQNAVYGASATLLIGQSFQSAALDSRDMEISEQLALTYAQLARLQPVLQQVVETQGLEMTWQELAKRVRATPLEGTQFLRLMVEAPSPQEAQLLADEITAALVAISPSGGIQDGQNLDQRFTLSRLTQLRQNIQDAQERIDSLEASMLSASTAAAMRELQHEIDALQALIVGWEGNYASMSGLLNRGGSPNSLTVVEPAQASKFPIRPRTSLNMLIVALAGFAVSFLLVIVLEILDGAIKSPDDLSQALGIQTVGAISGIRGKDKLVTAADPGAPIAEAYAMICTNLQSTTGSQFPRSIMVTSPGPAEGKSTTAANLAVAIAQTGLRTVIVDAHPVHPALHEIFQVPIQSGYRDVVLTGDISHATLLQTTPNGYLRLMTCGSPHYSTAALDGDRRSAHEAPAQTQLRLRPDSARQLVTQLVQVADVVIFDSPPLLSFADAITLASHVDGVLMVVKANKTRSSAVRQAVLCLHQVGAHLTGGILNQTSGRNLSVNFQPGYFPPQMSPIQQSSGVSQG